MANETCRRSFCPRIAVIQLVGVTLDPHRDSHFGGDMIAKDAARDGHTIGLVEVETAAEPAVRFPDRLAAYNCAVIGVA